jgi:hypothetical protein
MSVEPFKYLLQPVAVERDDKTGRIIREMPGEVIAVFSASQAVEAIAEFEKQIVQLTERNENGSRADNEVEDQVRQSGLSGQRS